MTAPSYKVGDRVRLVLDGKGWVGPGVEQLHGATGSVIDVEMAGAASSIFGPAYSVKLDKPLSLGWRTIEAMWFVDDYLESEAT